MTVKEGERDATNLKCRAPGDAGQVLKTMMCTAVAPGYLVVWDGDSGGGPAETDGSEGVIS